MIIQVQSICIEMHKNQL